MADTKKLNSIYKNILGDAKATIDAIQKYIKENSPQNMAKNTEVEEAPAESINKILNSVVCEETNAEIKKIIDNL